MRLVRYGVAMSLDGYIAGPNGEYDWIVMDPDIDFAGILTQFDTFLIGRKTFEAMMRMGNDAKSMPGIHNIVLSRTLRPSDYPHVTVNADAERVVTDASGQGSTAEAISAERLAGNYQLPNRTVIGIDSFAGGSGPPVPLFTDYTTGIIRTLFHSGAIDS